MKSTKHAEKLGRTAFSTGLKCVPALDADMIEHIKMVSHLGKSVLNQLDAWIRGWNLENLRPGSEWIERKSS